MQPTSQKAQTQTHSLDVFSGMISHPTSQETQGQTHSLDVFSGPMISHETSQETQRQIHLLDVFSDPMITHATSQETETDSQTGCIVRSHDQSYNFSGNTDRLTPWMCFQVP